MKRMEDEMIKQGRPVQIFCNKCGKEIPRDPSGYFHDFLEIQKRWGYFSDHDDELHSFDICQRCYDEWLAGFVLPAEKQ